MLRLDSTDLKILAVLQKEGRITKAALADRVNLTATPCWERLKRMEKAGVISGYGARLSMKALGPVSVIFMAAEIENHRSEDFRRFEQAILDNDHVTGCWAVGGGIDYLLRIVAKDVESYQLMVDEMLSSDIGLKRYYSYIMTKAIKEGPDFPLSLIAEHR